MLSMKTLRVAIVTVGTALLLGSGVAVAQTTDTVIDLDQAAVPGQTADRPLVYVAETLGTTGSAITSGAARGSNLLNNASELTLRVTSGAELLANNYFLRLALGDGLVFGAGLTNAACGNGNLVIGGDAGGSVAVCSITTTVSKGTRGGEGADAAAGALTVVVTDALAATSKDPGTYSASMSLHDDQFEAEEGVDAKASGHVGGTAAIIMVTSGINAEVKAGDAVVADVDTGFLWFVGPTAAASLGTVTVMEKNAPPAVGGVTFEAPLSAADGVAVPNGNLVGDADSTATPPVAGGMSVAIEGNLGIGVWNLVQINDSEGMAIDAVADTADPDTVGVQEPMCPANVGSASSPVDIAEPGTDSSLSLDKDDPGNMAMQSGMDPGTYKLCVTVDTAGARSNTMAVPSGEYMATAYALSGAAGTRPTDAIEVASGTIGTIKRNGASASVAYLTTSEKHNQRLIIVNRGNRPITITDISFQTEDGTEADLTDAAKAAAAAGLGAIGPGESMTTRVSDMVEITGNSRRAAAIMSFNGTAGNISVATTQVNLSDSSTDTVMWPVVEG